MEILKKKNIKWALAIAGAIGGFVYWKYVGCLSGTCPMQQNWVLSTLWGAGMGYLIGDMFKSEKTDNQSTQEKEENNNK